MNKLKFLSAAALLGVCTASFAQVVPPDAGKVVTGNAAAAPKAPADNRLPALKGPAEPAIEQDSGPKVVVNAIVITGNTLFSTEVLQALVRDQLGQSHSLNGMRAIARRLGDHYRAKGYPFARALVPVQDLKSGSLSIVVVEGKYGTVEPTGDQAKIVDGARPFLAPLRTGDVIEATRLERTLLILDDVPGVEVVPTVSPAAATGAGDLTVRTVLAEKTGGEVGVDNHGSRYTGEYRLHANWFRNSNLCFGDQIALGAMITDEAMWFGSATYELPLNGRGLRGQIGYSHTSYELGKDFASLGASGLARVWSAKLSYPIVRSQMFNLHVFAGFEHKTLQDDFASTSTTEHKFSQNFPVSLRFDKRDSFLGGAITYGQLTCTYGDLHLDQGLMAGDLLTAHKAGSFTKFNLDAARIQKLGAGFSAYLRGSFQWSNSNLDSSERFGLGGAEGVRAYPLGEGTGDQGWLGQFELRYEAGNLAPFVFFDAGSTDLNHAPWDTVSTRTRTISGCGVGVRAVYGKWSGDFIVARRLDGGVPESDSRPGAMRVLFSATRSF